MLAIKNVVCTADLNRAFDILKIQTLFERFKFNPNTFPALSVKLDGNINYLIFKSGKIVSTGAKSVEDCVNAVEKLATFLTSHGYSCHVSDFVITNIVANNNLGGPISLETLYDANKHATASLWVFWDPLMFPGMQFKFKVEKLTVIVFATGKYYITGGKTLENMQKVDKMFRNNALAHLLEAGP